MAFHIAENTQHVEEGLVLLLEQYKNKEKLEALLTAFLAPFQDLETLSFDIYNNFLLDNAVGEQLDFLGATVKEGRRERNDDVYRLYIKARIAVNRSNGRVPELLNILRIVSADSDTYWLRELPRASMILHVQQQTTNAQAIIFDDLIRQAKSAGVNLQTTWSLQTPSNRFKFSGTPNTIETSSMQGFSTVGGGSGGHLRGVTAG